MSLRIGASVGEGGVNRRDDIWSVQTLLIKVRKKARQSAITLDGIIGPETIGAIKTFQREQFGWNPPDGCVDPRGRTLKHLNLLTDATGPSYYLLEPVTVRRRGKWELAMGADGEIRVKPGDWLSKYSAVMDDNFYTIRPYVRPTPEGQFVGINDPNRIQIGESLYHVPTLVAFFRKNTTLAPPVPNERPMSEEEKRKVTRDFLNAEFKVRGERGQALGAAIELVEYTDGAVGVAEALTLIAEGSVLAAAATALAIGSAFLGIIGSTLDWLNACEAGTRMTGYRAATYATVAWGFGDQSPAISRTLLERVQSTHGSHIADQHKRAWRDSVNATVPALERSSLGERIPANRAARRVLLEAAKSGVRRLTTGGRASCCLYLLKQFESKFERTELSIWKSNYDLLYPK